MQDLRKRGAAIVGALTLLVVLAGRTEAQQGAPPTPQVTVSAPLKKLIKEWDEFTGRFEAMEQVDVRPRVAGFLDKILFVDGQTVSKGDPLFLIDQRPYKIAADSARADIARARAQVTQASSDLDRAAQLSQSSAITQRDVDTRKATLDISRAGLQTAEANLRTAELNLEWTQVVAPISGKISDRRVDIGNLIAGGDASATLLTVIVRTDPIRFVFDASESDYIRYARRAAADKQNGQIDSPVQVRLADENVWKRSGKMDFVDNAVNPRSGTIRGRAIFDNKDGFLTPGVFGRLRVLSGEADAFLVPDAAIVADQARKVVMVVDGENKVVPKVVMLGPLSDGLRVVRSGVTLEDKVIISGLANPMVRPGAKVEPKAGEIKLAAAQ